MVHSADLFRQSAADCQALELGAKAGPEIEPKNGTGSKNDPDPGAWKAVSRMSCDYPFPGVAEQLRHVCSAGMECMLAVQTTLRYDAGDVNTRGL